MLPPLLLYMDIPTAINIQILTKLVKEQANTEKHSHCWVLRVLRVLLPKDLWLLLLELLVLIILLDTDTVQINDSVGPLIVYSSSSIRRFIYLHPILLWKILTFLPFSRFSCQNLLQAPLFSVLFTNALFTDFHACESGKISEKWADKHQLQLLGFHQRYLIVLSVF